MYKIDALKCKLIDTNAYRLQASSGERIIIDGHGFHKALHVSVKAKETQDMAPTLYW